MRAFDRAMDVLSKMWVRGKDDIPSSMVYDDHCPGDFKDPDLKSMQPEKCPNLVDGKAVDSNKCRECWNRQIQAEGKGD
jgi:hypothetical protein